MEVGEREGTVLRSFIPGAKYHAESVYDSHGSLLNSSPALGPYSVPGRSRSFCLRSGNSQSGISHSPFTQTTPRPPPTTTKPVRCLRSATTGHLFFSSFGCTGLRYPAADFPEMTYYLRNWLSSQLGSVETPSVPQAPTVVPPPAENEDDDEDDVKTVRGDDDDAPPAFPSLNSAQRAAEPSSLPTILNDSSLMPPPPLPGLAARRPGVLSSSNMLGVPASGGSLMPPPSTTKAPSKKASRKVALAPGHGPLDWANLKKSGADLRVRRQCLCYSARSLMTRLGRRRLNARDAVNAQGAQQERRRVVRF